MGTDWSSLPDHLSERVATATDSAPRAGGEFVLYWAHHALRTEHNPALQVAFNGGSVMGLSVVGLALTGMGVFKITGYAINGFDYRPFATVIVLSVIAAFFGTWVGKRINDRVSERTFRLVFRILVTVTAVRLLYVNLTHS